MRSRDTESRSNGRSSPPITRNPPSWNRGRKSPEKTFPNIFGFRVYIRKQTSIIEHVRETEEPRRPKMTNTMNITAEQVEEMLNLHADAERRLERAIERKSNREGEYRAECIAIEKMLDIMGIEWC